MSLSNYPDYLLIREANRIESYGYDWSGEEILIDDILDFIRKPDEATFWFGDCASKAIFIPIEPEYDSNGQPIVEEVAGYDEQGEIWL